MESIEIECISCGREFEFTITEQQIYNRKNFDEPKRCPDCRRSKLRVRAYEKAGDRRRKEFDWSQVMS